MKPFIARIPRSRIVISGEDAASFLQGQLSQDLDAFAVGTATWSYLLTPQGKTVALIRVWKESDIDFSLFVEPAVGEKVLDRLTTFLFRAKASISSENIDVWCVRGAKVDGFDAGWPGVAGTDLLEQPSGDFEEIDAGLWETIRIGAGVPSNEIELSEERIPQELSFVDDAISFTKGCYVGQELVARIHSRGRVTKRLCGLIFDTSDLPKPGDQLLFNGETVGEITSVAPATLQQDNWWALGFVRHDVEHGSTLKCGDLGAKTLVSALPLLSFSQ